MKNLKTLVLIQLTVTVLILGCKKEAPSPSKEEVKKEAVTPKTSEKKAPSKKIVGKPIILASAKPPPEKDHKALDRYAVKLTTTKGEIVIDVHRQWSPHGADRFYTLVKEGFYTDVAFFRVVEGFMAQAGISGDPALNILWRKKTIPDDPVNGTNNIGMVTFAKTGRPDSRSTQFFINFDDNSRLDSMGFSPFGIVRDMTPVEALYSGYGEGPPRGKGPNQKRIHREGNEYLKAEFPKLDYIEKAEILD